MIGDKLPLEKGAGGISSIFLILLKIPLTPFFKGGMLNSTHWDTFDIALALPFDTGEGYCAVCDIVLSRVGLDLESSERIQCPDNPRM